MEVGEKGDSDSICINAEILYSALFSRGGLRTCRLDPRLQERCWLGDFGCGDTGAYRKN